ncbi:hypothetical protein [Neorhodopirellula lusitana]|uniref:hypothetical protein n=1 Tax=Neorhodopirellula lusitana TaxID=445327 RepID=UPI00384D8426
MSSTPILSPGQRVGAILVAISVVVFLIALTLFCVSLGLDFENEGWGNAGNNWDVTQFTIATGGFTVSIVLFFVGVQKISKR